MKTFDSNKLTNCFKMTVDVNGIKKLEEYITGLEQKNMKYEKAFNKLHQYLLELSYLTDTPIDEEILKILKEVSE